MLTPFPVELQKPLQEPVLGQKVVLAQEHSLVPVNLPDGHDRPRSPSPPLLAA
jgi:hypothetical protein